MLSIHPWLNSVQREVALDCQKEYNEKIYNLLLWIYDHEEKDIDAAVSNFSYELWELMLISSFAGEDIIEVLKPKWFECLWTVEVENFYNLLMKTQEYVDLILSWKITLWYTFDYKNILVCKNTNEGNITLLQRVYDV